MDEIPNQGLILNLLTDYYDNEADPKKDEYTSSHWQYYSNLFDVNVSDQGHLISLSGQAFGKLKWSGFADKILDQAAIFSHFVQLSHRKELYRLWQVGKKTCKIMGLDPTFDVFRQVCSIELLKRYLPFEISRKSMRVLMIGDGYGILSVLFKQIFPNSTIILVDLGKTLLFQAYYCQKAHPEYRHEIVTGVDHIDEFDYVYCPAEKLKRLEPYAFDIAINITSMQEMNSATTSNYFAFLRKHLYPNNLFYCCNRESKKLMGGEVSEFYRYPWKNEDNFLVDGQCPWHQYFFATTPTENGVYFLGIRIPIVRLYDGKHLHRLATMSVEEV